MMKEPELQSVAQAAAATIDANPVRTQAFMKEAVLQNAKKISFLTLALAFFLLPTLFDSIRNHAPGIAVLAGIAFSLALGNPYEELTSKLTSPLLGIAIVGMGCGMNLVKVLHAGAQGFVYTFAGIALGLGLGVLIGRKLKLPTNAYCLISVGTSICGGSAIAAAAPALKAKASDIAIASAVVFTLNAVALLVFPAVGHALGMSQHQFGYWSALGIHDTSSVVGASLAYGQEALEVGTTVKLARALWIVPVTLLLTAFVAKPDADGKKKFRLRVPWFIPAFLVASAAATWIPGLGECGAFLKNLSASLMIATLFLIGANLNRAKLKELGVRPILHGVILWVILSVVWGAAIHWGVVR